MIVRLRFQQRAIWLTWPLTFGAVSLLARAGYGYVAAALMLGFCAVWYFGTVVAVLSEDSYIEEGVMTVSIVIWTGVVRAFSAPKRWIDRLNRRIEHARVIRRLRHVCHD